MEDFIHCVIFYYQIHVYSLYTEKCILTNVCADNPTCICIRELQKLVHRHSMQFL